MNTENSTEWVEWDERSRQSACAASLRHARELLSKVPDADDSAKNDTSDILCELLRTIETAHIELTGYSIAGFLP